MPQLPPTARWGLVAPRSRPQVGGVAAAAVVVAIVVVAVVVGLVVGAAAVHLAFSEAVVALFDEFGVEEGFGWETLVY